LEQLGLVGLTMGDDGCKPLSLLKGPFVLNLSKTRIINAGVVHLRGLAQLAGFVASDTQVTAAGIAERKQALPKCVVRLQ